MQSMTRIAVSAAVVSLCVPGPGAARDCDPPSHEPWDWETTPFQMILAPGGDERCGGEAPVSDPSVESFYGDVLPSTLLTHSYAFDLDLDALTLEMPSELAVFQLRDLTGEPVVSVLLQATPAGARYKVFWTDDSGTGHTAFSGGLAQGGEVVVVSWVSGAAGFGTQAAPGELEVTVAGSVLVQAAVDNDETDLGEARIGVVDADQHPGEDSGLLRFFPRAKYWEF